jgi:hypothetical protein
MDSCGSYSCVLFPVSLLLSGRCRFSVRVRNMRHFAEIAYPFACWIHFYDQVAALFITGNICRFLGPNDSNTTLLTSHIAHSCRMSPWTLRIEFETKANSVAFIPQAKYSHREITAAGEMIPNFAGKGFAWSEQPIPTAANLSFMDRNC